MKRTTAVIGGGLGGLAAAARLAQAGFAVTVFERNARVGGKMNRHEWDGFRWDTGPSLLTMPYVLEKLWADLGRPLEQDLTLVRLPSTCLYHWRDGTRIREDDAFWQRDDVARFLHYARGLASLSEQTFLAAPLDEMWRRLTQPQALRELVHFPKIADMRTLSEVVRRFFPDDPHLRQLFERFATYNGSSPYRTPAAFNVIAAIQANGGGWWPRGGMYRIAESLANLAAHHGAEIRTPCPVEKLRLNEDDRDGPCWEVRLSGGKTESFDLIVCNQDVISAQRGLIEADSLQNEPAAELSHSGHVRLLAVRKSFPKLEHHNIFFSEDYPREFRDIFEDRVPPAQPTIYVAISSKTEPYRAPGNWENWFVLTNVPSRTPQPDEPGGDPVTILEKEFGLEGLRDVIAYERHLGPADFESLYGASQGALYGYASHGTMSSFRRPPIKHRTLPNLYFAGGTTHPGGGVPLVLLSGQFAANKIIRRFT